MAIPHCFQAPGGAAVPLTSWLADHREDIESALREHGAVLFRGFAVAGTQGFHDAARETVGEFMDYVEGASPRMAVGDGVYTSTEYPANLPIALHNELSYSHRWPARVAFFCVQPAQQGGATPLADCRRMLSRIRGDGHAAAFASGVRYVRRMVAGQGPGVAWPTVFGSAEAATVEEYCRTAGIDWAWRADGSLETRQIRPAAIIHPGTDEEVWFNQAHQWHPSNSGPDGEEFLREMFGDSLPMDAALGNGGPIPPEALASIRAAYDAERAVFAWQPGDVLVLDNMLVAHGRAPFSGHREVLVAMGSPVHLADVRTVDDYG